MVLDRVRFATGPEAAPRRDRVRFATAFGSPESSDSDSGSSQAGVGGGDGAGVSHANFRSCGGSRVSPRVFQALDTAQDSSQNSRCAAAFLLSPRSAFPEGLL